MEKGGKALLDHMKRLESVIILVLVAMMALVLLLGTVELGWIILADIISAPAFLLEIDELLDIYGLFMLVLIGIELLQTIIKTYVEESINHARIVVAVAIIAIARKVITLDVKDLGGTALLGIAAVVVGLSVSYYLLGKREHMAEKVKE
ncbi:phosphate-starvation-inducible PsiE family protein [Geomonas sp. RF6]|uniref:phosphate-starvation-inducible PsiE family protein n=1 Tax=Geomonas sp. RF6 TaxID=2897342 RepID=UPI001E4E2B0F|nr:phosphate-starvation-inducible PsiE family protein [Geomonas sp. RF6]UFS69804.1 phosphate-starvation-inducible PsiE family protein [Geomonas sp. RF6]